MILRKLVVDTNIYIGWLNGGLHADWLLGRGWARYLSAVVEMELRVGARTLPARRALDQILTAHLASKRVVSPDAATWDQAGRVLRRLHEAGREIRRSSLFGDVLIALSARSIGACVVTNDDDFDAIADVVDVEVIKALQ
jgi:predicted nucleic acid-binding protein